MDMDMDMDGHGHRPMHMPHAHAHAHVHAHALAVCIAYGGCSDYLVQVELSHSSTQHATLYGLLSATRHSNLPTAASKGKGRPSVAIIWKLPSTEPPGCLRRRQAALTSQHKQAARGAGVRASRAFDADAIDGTCLVRRGCQKGLANIFSPQHHHAPSVHGMAVCLPTLA